MTESRFELRTFGSDTMLNHHLSQKLKLIGRSKFNHLINTLTMSAFKAPLDPSTALGGFPGNNYSEVIYSSRLS
jgi:hypothetical protein